MKKLWSYLMRNESKKLITHIEQYHICNQHETNMQLIANESCNNCQVDICYLCTNNSHMVGCDVKCKLTRE